MVGNRHAVIEIERDSTEIHKVGLAEAGAKPDHQTASPRGASVRRWAASGQGYARVERHPYEARGDQRRSRGS